MVDGTLVALRGRILAAAVDLPSAIDCCSDRSPAVFGTGTLPAFSAMPFFGSANLLNRTAVAGSLAAWGAFLAGLPKVTSSEGEGLEALLAVRGVVAVEAMVPNGAPGRGVTPTCAMVDYRPWMLLFVRRTGLS